MRVHVMTRGGGMREEYAFLGEPPGEYWWRRYEAVTNFQLPSLLVESDPRGWRLYLAPITMTMVGPGGTSIGMVLVLEGAHGDPDDDVARVPELVGLWLDPERGAAEVSRTFSAAFPQDSRTITEWRTATDDRTGRLVTTGFHTAVRELRARDVAPSPVATADRWAGAVDGTASRAAFVHRIGELLHGAEGRAVVANYCLEPDVHDGLAGYPVLREPDTGPLALLVQRFDDSLGDAPVELPVSRGKALSRPPEPESASVARTGVGTRTRILVSLLLMGVLLVFGLLVVL
ncbi:hypothetical protein [Umezawaea sp. Da 62-37]|uniref:hypothetical protein n=1 Tax=Umezawaea sp. Da 62-37 TaxID=3075927 RepID=UPI0028F6C675|nr:hypothetical protein [Umezawaea sp. Da 62-37]WNV86166.1 hypothetical protein RM788_49990 [Umezawaea sp. Da 62-37]